MGWKRLFSAMFLDELSNLDERITKAEKTISQLRNDTISILDKNTHALDRFQKRVTMRGQRANSTPSLPKCKIHHTCPLRGAHCNMCKIEALEVY